MAVQGTSAALCASMKSTENSGMTRSFLKRRASRVFNSVCRASAVRARCFVRVADRPST